jgi:dolichyl-phosphate beta-glucosyltransferase
MNDPQLSVIIPAFNEEERLGPTLTKVTSYLNAQSYEWELLVVDDGSRDRTSDLVSALEQKDRRVRLVRNKTNQGKCSSVRSGMVLARGQYRVFTDADLSTPIEEVARFMTLAEKHPVVIGSRRVAGANLTKRQPWSRELSGRIFSLLVRVFTLPGFLDTQCGFKMFTAEAARNIFPLQQIPGFGFDVEILYIAKKVLKYDVLEAPVTWEDSSPTKVNLFRDSSRMFKNLFEIKKLHPTR